MLDDIIAAISTPVGTGGIGIVRVSGTGAIAMVDTFFKSSKKRKLIDQKSHTITYGTIIDKKSGEIVDEVLVSVMKAPNTYTKQDVVEINGHGGIIAINKILESCLKAGARMAEPGEFTKRAFLNGRIDLTQAEAVIDLIQAKTDLSRKAAVQQLEGSLKNKVMGLRDNILDMVASIEAAIDYPEHDIEEETYGTMEKGCKAVLTEVDKLLKTADQGKIIREGLSVVILGKPNVGKSSLLNTLLKEDRAIVTDVPGTTRDTVEEFFNLDGIPIKIIDTAGIRETQDIVEKIGVEKSMEFADKADLLLIMLDASKPLWENDIEILKLSENKKAIVLYNKIDLNSQIEKDQILPFVEAKNIIPLSVKENKGIEELTQAIKDMFFGGSLQVSHDTILQTVRQKNALYQARESLLKALQTIATKMPEDFISMDLQDAMHHLGEITGETVDDEIIDRIFTKFCLGK